MMWSRWQNSWHEFIMYPYFSATLQFWKLRLESKSVICCEWLLSSFQRQIVLECRQGLFCISIEKSPISFQNCTRFIIPHNCAFAKALCHYNYIVSVCTNHLENRLTYARLLSLLLWLLAQGTDAGSSKDYARRKEQLDLREKELAAREAELKRQQDALIASGAIKPKKNWPICYPVTHHDIKGDVSPSFLNHLSKLPATAQKLDFINGSSFSQLAWDRFCLIRSQSM